MLVNLAPIFGIRTPKLMSSAFDPHMGVFVDAQDKLVILPLFLARCPYCS